MKSYLIIQYNQRTLYIHKREKAINIIEPIGSFLPQHEGPASQIGGLVHRQRTAFSANYILSVVKREAAEVAD